MIFSRALHPPEPNRSPDSEPVVQGLGECEADSCVTVYTDSELVGGDKTTVTDLQLRLVG